VQRGRATLEPENRPENLRGLGLADNPREGRVAGSAGEARRAATRSRGSEFPRNEPTRWPGVPSVETRLAHQLRHNFAHELSRDDLPSDCRGDRLALDRGHQPCHEHGEVPAQVRRVGRRRLHTRHWHLLMLPWRDWHTFATWQLEGIPGAPGPGRPRRARRFRMHACRRVAGSRGHAIPRAQARALDGCVPGMRALLSPGRRSEPRGYPP